MNYEKKIKNELENDKVWKALRETLKPEEREEVDAIIGEFIKVAGAAIVGISQSTANEQITLKDIENAISDRTGRK